MRMMDNKLEYQYNLLDLNEQILRNIFTYFDYLYVYQNLRNVCKKFRQFVDGYIKLGGTFMLVTKEIPSKLIYVFKQCNKPVSIALEPIEELPHPFKDRTREIIEDRSQFFDVSSWMSVGYKLGGDFGSLINNKIIVGTFYNVSFKEESVDSCIRKKKSRNKKRTGKSYKYGGMIIPYLYEYDLARRKWLPILSLDTEPFLMKKYDGISNSFVYSSVIGDSIMTGVFVESMNHCHDIIVVDNRQFDYNAVKFQFHVANDGFYSKLTSPNDRSVNNQIYGSQVSSITYSTTFLDTPKFHMWGCCKKQDPTKCQGVRGLFRIEGTSAEELSQVIDKASNLGLYNPISMDKNTMVLIASTSYTSPCNPIAYQILWRETLKQYEVDVKLSKVLEQFLQEKVMGYCLTEHAWQKVLYLRLKDNVYIIEGFLDRRSMESIKTRTYSNVGLRCDRYNMTEEKYYPSTNVFPHFLCCIDMVVTDKAETFAILLGIKADTSENTYETEKMNFKTSVLILTEKYGLKLMSTEADNALSHVLSKEQEARFSNLRENHYEDCDFKFMSVTDYLLLRMK